MNRLRAKAGIVRALSTLAAVLASACTGAGAADDLPRLHVVRVNETTAAALAGVDDDVKFRVETCRALMHMPAGSVPAVPAGRLAKIVFFEDEAFFDGDRSAHYKTTRSIAADSGSACQPYLLVQREATVADGCDTRIMGRSGNDHDFEAPATAPPPWKPLTQVAHTGRPAELCARKRKPMTADGVPADSAGNGVSCIWRSRLIVANLGAALKARMPPSAAGSGPAQAGLDDCLWQRMPRYASAHAEDADVVLRTHSVEPARQKDAAMSTGTGGMAFFAGNTRLQALDIGGAAAAKFDAAAVDAFVHLSPTQAL